MKYDILTLQVLQEALEKVEEIRFDKQRGICGALYHAGYDHDRVEWMRKNYMPHRRIGAFWWPTFFDVENKNEQDLIQSKADRIAFLQRIIEDLMCGE